MTKELSYYVYVYIDPRNFQEFYFGKGCGSRKEAHLFDVGTSKKAKRIKEIRKDGLEPIVRVIAKGLTEQEAFLVEKTLLWKLGQTLTNISSGHFAEKFRPHNALYRQLPGFDYERGFYYINVGEHSDHRLWEDCSKFGYLSAGGGKKWSDQIRSLKMNDIVVAYLKGRGYVGVGRVVDEAVRAENFRSKRKLLKDSGIKGTALFKNGDNEKAEFLVKISWIKKVSRSEAKWKRNSGLFTTQLVRARLDGQPETIDFIEKEFGIKISDLLSG